MTLVFKIICALGALAGLAIFAFFGSMAAQDLLGGSAGATQGRSAASVAQHNRSSIEVVATCIAVFAWTAFFGWRTFWSASRASLINPVLMVLPAIALFTFISRFRF